MLERRTAERVNECFVLRINTAEKRDRMGVVWNHSQTGILFATPSRFRPGDRLELSPVGGKKGLPASAASVVRSQPLQAAGPIMRFLVAVRYVAQA